MIAPTQQSALFYRTPVRLAAARSEAELLHLLPSTLRGLYPSLGRYALFLGGERGALVAVEKCDMRSCGGGRSLLESLKSRLPRERERCATSRARLFPSPRGGPGGSLMSVPLRDARAQAGLLVVEAGPATPDFDRLDLEVLEGVAAMFSLALQRLRSRESDQSLSEADRDRKAAREVQRRLMGRSLPAGAGVAVDARYLPALDVGGDFYELTDLGDGVIGGAIGDVSGRGVSAALIMSRVSSDVRRALRSGAGPSAVLRDVNQTLGDVGSETFVTASCIRLDRSHRKLTVANAGHIPLFIRRASGDAFTFGPPSGTPLGMVPCDYADEEIEFGPLDTVLLMTDGLVEALDRPGDRMGVDFLLRLLRSSPPEPEIVNARILGAVDRRRRGRPLDDVTLVALRLEA